MSFVTFMPNDNNEVFKDKQSISQILASFSSEVNSIENNIPFAVLNHAKLCVADSLHAMLLGSDSLTSDLLWKYIKDNKDNKEHKKDKSINNGCTAINRGILPPESAALYNGSLAAVHEIDDVHWETSIHTGTTIVPASLAAAEWVGNISGKKFLTAIVLGYEIAIRLSIAAGNRHYYFFHPTSTCGTIGAAVASAIIFNLNEEQISKAIGLAVDMASGLKEGINSEAVMVKHLHSGLAAEKGIRAARLAKFNWPAPSKAIEGERGFLSAMARPGKHAPEEAPTQSEILQILTQKLDYSRWLITNNIFKRYPFCLACFEGIEGLKYILKDTEHRVDDIDRILVETSPIIAWLIGRYEINNELQAKFSMPYALALVLSGREAEHVPMQKEALKDPEVLKWMPKIKVIGVQEIGRRRARITVLWHDGTSSKADQTLINMDETEVINRLNRVAKSILGDNKSFSLLNYLNTLEDTDCIQLNSFLT